MKSIYMPQLTGPVILNWKVTSGSPVQQGETVAVVITQSLAASATSSIEMNMNTKNTSQQEEEKQQQQQQQKQQQHRRPKKRRRPTTSDAKEHQKDPANSGSAATTPAFSLVATFPSSKNNNPSTAETVCATAACTTTTKMATVRGSSNIPVVAPMDGILFIMETEKGTSDSSNGPKQIGYVVVCEHPTVMDGLCVVCGKKMREFPKGNDGESEAMEAEDSDSSTVDKNGSAAMAATRNKSQLLTVAGGSTVVVSEAETRRMAEQEAAKLHLLRKLSLVLDLDHTIVHATHDPRAMEWSQRREDVRTLVLPVCIPGSNLVFPMQHVVKLRPFLREFIEQTQPLYEMAVYTAGTRRYAEEITLLVARHLVRAKLDTAQLEQLHHTLVAKRAELDYLKRRTEAPDKTESQTSASTSSASLNTSEIESDSRNRDDSEPSRAESNKADDGTKAAEGNLEFSRAVSGSDNENDDKKLPANSEQATTEEAATVEPEPPGKKRRKVVSFGPDPPSSKQEKANPPDLSALQAEIEHLEITLEEARRLEQSALEKRQKLFGGRIVSRTDVGEELGRETKSLKRMFPSGGEMAVVVDDREDVWANATGSGEPPDNLLLVRPYHWQHFSGFAEVNNAPGQEEALKNSKAADDGTNDNPSDDTKRPEDDDDDDEQLIRTADVLKQIHSSYYDTSDDEKGSKENRATVPELVKKMRSQVLAESRMLLSGLVPINRPTGSGARRPFFVRHAENLGAVVVPHAQADLQYVVAAKDGTEKVLQARRLCPSVIFVQPTWLLECVWTMSRRDTKPHLLLPAVKVDDGERSRRDVQIKLLAQELHASTKERNYKDENSSNDIENTTTAIKDDKDDPDNLFAMEFNKELVGDDDDEEDHD